MALTEDRFTPQSLDDAARREAEIIRRRSWFALFVLVSGVIAMIAGIAVIFWPAALIFGGLCLVLYGCFFIDIPEPRGRRKGQGEP